MSSGAPPIPPPPPSKADSKTVATSAAAVTATKPANTSSGAAAAAASTDTTFIQADTKSSHHRQPTAATTTPTTPAIPKLRVLVISTGTDSEQLTYLRSHFDVVVSCPQRPSSTTDGGADNDADDELSEKTMQSLAFTIRSFQPHLLFACSRGGLIIAKLLAGDRSASASAATGVGVGIPVSVPIVLVSAMATADILLPFAEPDDTGGSTTKSKTDNKQSVSATAVAVSTVAVLPPLRTIMVIHGTRDTTNPFFKVRAQVHAVQQLIPARAVIRFHEIDVSVFINFKKTVVLGAVCYRSLLTVRPSFWGAGMNDEWIGFAFDA